MSCYGAPQGHANEDSLNWQKFRDQTVELSRQRKDERFIAYVMGVSDRAWAHILEENCFTPQNAEKRLWNFYRSDILGIRD